MKKKNSKILLGLLASTCVGMTAGCGGESSSKYSIEAKVVNDEYGYITGGGKFSNGANVSLKIYPNEGCMGTANDSNIPPVLQFLKNGAAEGDTPVELSVGSIIDNKYYEYNFTVNDGKEDPSLINIGTYTATFTCASNTPADVGSAVVAQSDVEFILHDKDGNKITDAALINQLPGETIDSKHIAKIGSGMKINEVRYLDELEGRIEWYKDSSFTQKYNFSDPVYDDFVLYGKMEGTTEEAIVRDSIAVLNQSKSLYFTFVEDGKTYIMDVKKGENNAIDINYYEEENAGEYIRKFMIKTEGEGANRKQVYYEIDDKNALNNGSLLHHKLSDAIFGKYNVIKIENDQISSGIENISKFYKINQILSEEGLIFDRKEDGENNHIKKTITYKEAEGEDVNANGTKGEEIEIECRAYTIKDGDETVLAVLYVYRGRVYQIEYSDDGSVLDIDYSKNSGNFVPEAQAIRNLFVVQFKSNDGNLNTELENINASFDSVLKIRPSIGETLDDLIENHETLNNLLKKYDYFIKDGATIIDDLSTYLINNDKIDGIAGTNALEIVVKGSYADVATGLQDLALGNYKVITTGKLFDEDHSVDFNVGEVNVIDPDTTKPSEMNGFIWNSLRTLVNLENNYYKFTYDDTNNLYSFFKNKKDSIPFVSIKVDENCQISELHYYYMDALGKVTTYTSVFDYSSRVVTE